jgi:Dullard-like phosphatase family protein
LYEIIVFTSATKEYADPIENSIEQNEKYFDARLYRHHTIIYENDFVKDISRIGRPLDSIIIVDNMPQNFRLQKENGIFIKPFWGDDIFDTALFSLADILEKIHNQFDDVRHGIYFYKDEILNKVTSNFFKNAS